MTIIILLLVACLILSLFHFRTIKKDVQTKIDYTQQIKKVSNLRRLAFRKYPYPFKKSKEDFESNLRKLEEERGVLSQLTAMLSGRKWTRTIALRASASTYAVTFYLISLPSFSGEHSLIFLVLFVFLLVGWTLLARSALRREKSATTSIKLELDLI